MRCKLRDFAALNQKSYTAKLGWKYLYYLDTGNITKNVVVSYQKFSIPDKAIPSRAKRLVKNGTIIYSTVRPNQLHYGLLENIPNNLLVSTGFTTIDVNPKFADERYVFYFLTQESITKSLHALAEQSVSTYPSIKADDIGDIEIDIPPLETQKKISKLVSSIDEKIKLNKEINDNLLNQLKALFKHDYLENNDNKAWKNVEFGSIVSKFATGLNPRKNFVLGHGENYYVTIKNMGDNRIYLDDKCDKVDDEAIIKINARSDLKQGDFLFSGIGTIGRVYYIDKTPENWNISESVFTIRPNNTVSSEFMYLLLLSDELQNYVQQHAQGSAQKGIRMADFKKYKLLLPNIEKMEELSDMWRPLINQSKLLDEENNRLASIRDSLLPKLMSGEIDVDSIEL